MSPFLHCCPYGWLPAGVECGQVLGRVYVLSFVSVFTNTGILQDQITPDRAGYALCSMSKSPVKSQQVQHHHSTSFSGPGSACLPFPPEHGLLLQLLLIIFGNKAVSTQLGLLVLRKQAGALCSVVPS